LRTCLALLLAAMALRGGEARGQENLIPNSGFTAKDALQSWRYSFPYEPQYVDNAGYVKPASMDGRACALLDLPPGVAGNQGGKIESAFVKAEPGETYRVEIDCMTYDFGAKLFAEAWTTDPKPISTPDKFRVPALAGMPPLVMCYRAQIPDPPGGSKKWTTVSREFTVPETVRVAGQEQKPEYLSLKVVVYAGTPNGGKSYFTNFRLSRIK
jgi:hypothetical protein